jgi:nitrogen PTS system EIIA component
MDLKIRDVADLLQVSEGTIRRWLRDGKIPAYRLNKQYRFNRTEIEAWMMQHKLGDSASSDEANSTSHRTGSQHYSLFRAIHKGGVMDQVEGDEKETVIRNATHEMAKLFQLDAGVLTDLLLDRERLMPTALGHGVAVPHTRDFLLNTHFDVVTVVYPKEPLEFGALDGKPVHTLFFLFACEDKRHLHLLAKLAHLCSRPENLELLKSRPDQNRLLAAVKQWEGSLSPRHCAVPYPV